MTEALLSPDAVAIWNLVREHVGHEAAITAATIREVLAHRGHVIGDAAGTKVREVISRHQGIFPLPLASCSRGYFIAETADEVRHYRASLRSRAMYDWERLTAFTAVAKANGWTIEDDEVYPPAATMPQGTLFPEPAMSGKR